MLYKVYVNLICDF